MPLTEAQYIPNGRTIVNALAFDDSGKTVITRDINGRILFVGNLTTTPVEVLAWDPATNIMALNSGGTVVFTTNGLLNLALNRVDAGPKLMLQFQKSGVAEIGLGLASNDADLIFMDANNIEKLRLTQGGILLLGTTVTSGSQVGDLVLANAKSLRFANSAGTAATSVITLSGASNLISIGPAGTSVTAIGAPGSVVSAGAGSLVFGNGSQLMWSKADNSTALEMMRLSVGNVLVIGSGGAIATIGEPLTTTGASAGDLVLPNSRSVRIQNSGGTNTTPFTTMTLKAGSGGGDYTTTSATYVDVDATNLKFIVTIPTGFSLLVNATCAVKHSTLAATVGLAIKDGSVVAEEVIEAAVAGDREHMGLTHIIVGDDASHTITLQWKTSAATATMNNASSTLNPRMTFFMAPSA